MFFTKPDPGPEPLYLARSDALNPLASYSKHGFELDDAFWPSVEHYYQGMKFEDIELRQAIRGSDHPATAKEQADRNKKLIREDWKKIREVIMTRAVYIKCRTHPDVAEALLATGERKILESSQYDYFWGCGRDGRGNNTYGKVLMAVRDKLREERGK